MDAERLAASVRQACIEAAVTAYEDAGIRGLCEEGRWEAAISALQSLDLRGLIEKSEPAPGVADAGAKARSESPGGEVPASDATSSEYLFSYGTLQLAAVQMATFGRALTGTSDAMTRHELLSLQIEDPAVIAISGKPIHTMASFTGRTTDVITGMVFAITPAELRLADEYEVPAVRRVAVVLQSGLRAWVYVDARSASAESSSGDGRALREGRERR